MTTKKKTQFFYNDALISKSSSQSSFRAVKNLVEAQNNIEMVKNRIKVLQINEQKNLSKIQNQQQQIQKITMARNEHLQQLRKMGINKIQRERMIEQIKNKNQALRKQHQLKMSTIKQEIQTQKTNQYKNSVQTTQLHESLILENKISFLHKKQQKRNFVVQNQQKSKENIIKFYQDKTKNIYQQNMSQIKKINRTRQKKEKQLSDFTNLQMEMIKRHSQSQVAYKEMKSKLDDMLGKIRSQKRKGMKQMKSSVHRNLDQNTYKLQGV